jgi:Uma2 family endonuclease
MVFLWSQKSYVQFMTIEKYQYFHAMPIWVMGILSALNDIAKKTMDKMWL